MLQIINPKTGEFTIAENFIVSGGTTIDAIKNYFGKALQVREFNNGHSHYSIFNFKIGELYFILTFYFRSEKITKINILVQPVPYDPNASWDDFDEKAERKKGEYIKQWFATQMSGDNKAYGWGNTAVFYDPHNLSTSCALLYSQD